MLSYQKCSQNSASICLKLYLVQLLPPATKLRDGNVFTPVCHSVQGGSLSRGSLSRGVSVEGVSERGVSVQGVCVRETPIR